MYIECKKIEGLMQSATIAYEFCERAGLSEKIAHALPDWFFLEDGESEKQRAVKVARIYDETADFKVRYSDQLAARVKDAYPARFVLISCDPRFEYGCLHGFSFSGAINENLIFRMNN